MRAALSLVLVFLASCGSGSPYNPRELYVANRYSVAIFDASLGGDVPPLRAFAPEVDPSGLSGIVLDPLNNEIFIADRASITVYRREPDGNIRLARTISGDSTALAAPTAIAVDNTNDEIFVGNFSNNSITVYARSASGNVPPLRSISGDATGLDGVSALAVDAARNELLVTTRSVPVTVFSRTDSGNAAPLRMISLPGPAHFVGMALDLLHDEVLVTSFTIIDRYHFTTSVIVYERTAGGEAVPSRTILGEPSGVAGPMLGIAVDPVHNELFVAHSSNNSVAVYDRTADGTVSPLRTISGDASGLDRPFALALWMAAPVPPSPTNATP